MGHSSHVDRNLRVQVSSFGSSLSKSTPQSVASIIQFTTTKFESIVHVRRNHSFEVIGEWRNKGRRAGRAGRQAGRQAGRKEGRKVGRKEGR